MFKRSKNQGWPCGWPSHPRGGVRATQGHLEGWPKMVSNDNTLQPRATQGHLRPLEAAVGSATWGVPTEGTPGETTAIYHLTQPLAALANETGEIARKQSPRATGGNA